LETEILPKRAGESRFMRGSAQFLHLLFNEIDHVAF
jgi:hypothetical protein